MTKEGKSVRGQIRKLILELLEKGPASHGEIAERISETGVLDEVQSGGSTFDQALRDLKLSRKVEITDQKEWQLRRVEGKNV